MKVSEQVAGHHWRRVYDYADVLHKSFIFYFQQRSGKLPLPGVPDLTVPGKFQAQRVLP